MFVVGCEMMRISASKQVMKGVKWVVKSLKVVELFIDLIEEALEIEFGLAIEQ